jgi:hypothetical protein
MLAIAYTCTNQISVKLVCGGNGLKGLAFVKAQKLLALLAFLLPGFDFVEGLPAVIPFWG